MGTLSRVIFDPDTTPPSIPGSVTATALSQTTIRVAWAASTDTGGSGLAGYRVLRSTTSGGTYSQVGGDLSTSSLVFDDTSLTAGTTRFYRIVAFDLNSNVSSQSSIVSATTQASNPGTGLSWPAHVPGYISILPAVGGYGMNTVAGSGRHLGTPATTVILVNSLASGNSGAAVGGYGANVFQGTWEYAWRHSASPKVIIPIVSGWVPIQDSIPCQTGTPPRPGYVSYYGQCAPNPGLFLRGANVVLNGASNVAVWHLRSYMGDDSTGLGAGARDCLSSGYGAGQTQSIVLVNCEFAWSVDELADFNRSHNQISFLNCAFIEPLHRSTIVHPEDGPGVDHGFGPLVGGDTGQVQTSAVSTFRNLWAHTTGRNPMVSAQTFVHANNFHYDHGRPTGGAGSGVQILFTGATQANYANIVGNAFMRGPNNDGTMVAISVTGTPPSGSAGYSNANAQFGWTAPANQNGFFTSAPSGYIASTLQTDAYPGSWGSGLTGVLQWAANPLSPTTAEWHAYVDLIQGTVGAQPRWRTADIGRVSTVISQIRDRINGVAQSNQFVDTVTQAGGWFSVPSVTIDPLSPGSHWHAALPTGSDRDTPYTSGTFSDGSSRVGYTRLEAWAYEQHLFVTGVDTIAPSVPTGVTATALSQTTIRIAWAGSTDTGGSGLAGYRVYRSTTSGGTYTQVGSDLSASTLSFDDTSLSASQTRFYKVAAFDASANVSAQSAAASATTQSAGGGAVGFTPDSGFVLSGTIGHGSVLTLTRSSGSFGTHADYNSGNYTWLGHNHLLGLFLDFEDGVIAKRGVNLTSNTTATLSQLWSASTVNSPVGLTRNALRVNPGGDGEERGALEWYAPTTTGVLYTSMKLRFPANCRGGKFYRVFYSSSNGYSSTGYSDSAAGLGIRYISNESTQGTYFSPLDFTAGVWSRFESVTISGGTMQQWLDRAVGNARAGANNLSTGNSIDIGHQVDANFRYTQPSPPGPLPNENRYADVIHNLTQARLEIGNASSWAACSKTEMQVPLSWATLGIQFANNWGEFATSLAGKYLYFIDANGAATRCGQFT